MIPLNVNSPQYPQINFVIQTDGNTLQCLERKRLFITDSANPVKLRTHAKTFKTLFCTDRQHRMMDFQYLYQIKTKIIKTTSR